MKQDSPGSLENSGLADPLMDRSITSWP